MKRYPRGYSDLILVFALMLFAVSTVVGLALGVGLGWIGAREIMPHTPFAPAPAAKSVDNGIHSSIPLAPDPDADDFFQSIPL